MHVSYECLPLFPFVPREVKGIMDLMGDKPWVRKKKTAGQLVNARSAAAPVPSWVKKKRLAADGGGGAAAGTTTTTTRQALARTVDSLLRTPRRRSSIHCPLKRYSTLSPLNMNRALPGDGDHDLWQLLDSMDKSVGKLFPQFAPPPVEAARPSSSLQHRMAAPPARGSSSSSSSGTALRQGSVNRRFNPHVFQSYQAGDL